MHLVDDNVIRFMRLDAAAVRATSHSIVGCHEKYCIRGRSLKADDADEKLNTGGQRNGTDERLR